jgi:hypothetical protein
VLYSRLVLCRFDCCCECDDRWLAATSCAALASAVARCRKPRNSHTHCNLARRAGRAGGAGSERREERGNDSAHTVVQCAAERVGETRERAAAAAARRRLCSARIAGAPRGARRAAQRVGGIASRHRSRASRRSTRSVCGACLHVTASARLAGHRHLPAAQPLDIVVVAPLVGPRLARLARDLCRTPLVVVHVCRPLSPPLLLSLLR